MKGGDCMDIKEECEKALNAGISIRFLANKMKRDPSTISKWLQGERNISSKVQEDLIDTLLNLKNQWLDIMNE